MRVDRCVCHARLFAELLAVAEREGARTIAELQAHVEFGKTCRLCRPYMRRALVTGESVFSEVVTDDG